MFRTRSRSKKPITMLTHKQVIKLVQFGSWPMINMICLRPKLIRMAIMSMYSQPASTRPKFSSVGPISILFTCSPKMHIKPSLPKIITSKLIRNPTKFTSHLRRHTEVTNCIFVR
ncbi:hypothetical protein V6Z11_D10G148500 [Gossypium hirsutum]